MFARKSDHVMRQCTCDSECSDSSELCWMFRWYFERTSLYMWTKFGFGVFSANEYHIYCVSVIYVHSLILAMRLKCHWRMWILRCLHSSPPGSRVNDFISSSVFLQDTKLFRTSNKPIQIPRGSKMRENELSKDNYFDRRSPSNVDIKIHFFTFRSVKKSRYMFCSFFLRSNSPYFYPKVGVLWRWMEKTKQGLCPLWSTE